MPFLDPKTCICLLVYSYTRLLFMVPVQFITHATSRYSYIEGARLALRGGCRWVQLRMKEANDTEAEATALEVQALCKEQGATFIIDDRVELAKKVQADGVHLGKHDMPVAEARQLLGQEFIIGGTANTLEEVLALKQAGADYVGVGPFRFTETKQNLAPILGLDGYAAIVKGLQEAQVRIPLCAIGGIRLADVSDLIDAGVSGIAVSSAILGADDPEEMMRRFLEADR